MNNESFKVNDKTIKAEVFSGIINDVPATKENAYIILHSRLRHALENMQVANLNIIYNEDDNDFIVKALYLGSTGYDNETNAEYHYWAILYEGTICVGVNFCNEENQVNNLERGYIFPIHTFGNTEMYLAVVLFEKLMKVKG